MRFFIFWGRPGAWVSCPAWVGKHSLEREAATAAGGHPNITSVLAFFSIQTVPSAKLDFFLQKLVQKLKALVNLSQQELQYF